MVEHIKLYGEKEALFNEIHDEIEASTEFARGAEQSAFVREWVSDAQAAEDVGEWPLAVEIVERGKYGRWVSRVRRRSDGEDLTERLRDEFETRDEVEFRDPNGRSIRADSDDVVDVGQVGE